MNFDAVKHFFKPMSKEEIEQLLRERYGYGERETACDLDSDEVNARIEFIKKAKESYRKDARAMTLEEKIESVELMREASKEAKRAMQEALKKT